MDEPLEMLYTKIGQTILDIVEAEWEKVFIHVFIKPDVIQLKCSYYVVNSEIKNSFTPNRALVELFRELHNRMVLELNDDWKMADFLLTNDSKFEIKFDY